MNQMSGQPRSRAPAACCTRSCSSTRSASRAATGSRYPILRFKDTPKVTTVVVNRPDREASGSGEPPLVSGRRRDRERDLRRDGRAHDAGADDAGARPRLPERQVGSTPSEGREAGSERDPASLFGRACGSLVTIASSRCDGRSVAAGFVFGAPAARPSSIAFMEEGSNGEQAEQGVLHARPSSAAEPSSSALSCDRHGPGRERPESRLADAHRAQPRTARLAADRLVDRDSRRQHGHALQRPRQPRPGLAERPADDRRRGARHVDGAAQVGRRRLERDARLRRDGRQQLDPHGRPAGPRGGRLGASRRCSASPRATWASPSRACP